MGEKTNISWADSTINFWYGCKKISSGCKMCYMYRDLKRYGKDPTLIIKTKPNTFRKALKWKEPRRIFTCSWSDFFIEEADGVRNEAWEVIRKTPHHTWLILTKRAERINKCLPKDWGEGYDNVWLGVTVEDNNSTVLRRVKILNQEVKAKLKFVSFEPLLEDIKLPIIKEDLKCMDWIIVGGESGNETGECRYRKCDLVWIENIRKFSTKNNIPFFLKQMGTYLSKEHCYSDRHGADINGYPEYWRIREIPIVDN